MRLRSVLASSLAVALSACGPRTGSDPTSWIVDRRGFGPVNIGMSLAELSQAVGESLRPRYEVNEECDFVHPRALPAGVALMILKDSVARIDVEGAGILTREGAGVGDLETRLLELYAGRARVQPHKYTGPTGHYVIVEERGDTLHRIIFETDGQHVQRYRAGRSPGVDFVEGCA